MYVVQCYVTGMYDVQCYVTRFGQLRLDVLDEVIMQLIIIRALKRSDKNFEPVLFAFADVC